MEKEEKQHFIADTSVLLNLINYYKYVTDPKFNSVNESLIAIQDDLFNETKSIKQEIFSMIQDDLENGEDHQTLNQIRKYLETHTGDFFEIYKQYNGYLKVMKRKYSNVNNYDEEKLSDFTDKKSNLEDLFNDFSDNIETLSVSKIAEDFFNGRIELDIDSVILDEMKYHTDAQYNIDSRRLKLYDESSIRGLFKMINHLKDTNPAIQEKKEELASLLIDRGIMKDDRNSSGNHGDSNITVSGFLYKKTY